MPTNGQLLMTIDVQQLLMTIDVRLLMTINGLTRSTPWLQPVMSSYATVSGIVVFAELMFAGWWIGRKKRTRGPSLPHSGRRSACS
ncbi:hypothetical protein ACTXG6_33720 [Pseudonocardia sp. Cha107L01]|uniref:hypothetical protein n=1 Tax=Pseudonocardia sp. Cha107L01 TaxID=3457576 RepID=UPI00403EE600